MASIDAEPIDIGRTGRSLIGFVSVAGIALGVALVLALQPDSLRSDAHDVVALTNSRLRVASFDYARRNPDRVSEPMQSADSSIPVELPEWSFSSRLVDTFRFSDESIAVVTRPTAPPESTTTTAAPAIVTSTRAMGVLSESGEHLLTTMAAVDGIESIDVRLPNGKMVRGHIVHTLPDLHVAVLSISDEATTGARADIKASGLGTEGMEFSEGQPVMVLAEVPLEFVIGQSLDGVVIALESFAGALAHSSSVAEGSPLVSKTGHLIGLCTHEAGRLGFIPVNLLESALSKLLNVDGGAPTTSPTQ